MAVEVSIIFPQRWNRGKMLYTIIRYGTLAFIALQLSRDYRVYLSISPMGCKIFLIASDAIHWVTYLACDFSLALCLGALLQAKAMYLVGIVILSCAMPFVNAVIYLIGQCQYPAEPVSLLDAELGYPCYVPSSESWAVETVMYIAGNVRTYVNLVATALLALLGVFALVVRYKGQGGRLVQVIRRDGGLHYLSLLVIRMASAIIQTPAVVGIPEFDASPMLPLISMANFVILPILAQRLLINMRKADYMGSEPFASKLLFAPPAPGSEDDLGADFDSYEMTREPSAVRHRGPAGEVSEAPEVRLRESNA
ncbi:hypothetical protein FA13DRAFT_1735433 [Coprinellus micaceus]|uniref:G-protein coupled receptors family 1 profile domain-containing protein n=1 Tax=Coprinellus micaceus TaxID=71717 RepID=A0A4Y7T383_COPMI|nr:hypothetical protein FA13DRAFT_1735433 [Coprinellus micaceus]